MTREFVWTTAFLKGWNRCGFSNDDLVRLEDALIPSNPITTHQTERRNDQCLLYMTTSCPRLMS